MKKTALVLLLAGLALAAPVMAQSDDEGRESRGGERKGMQGGPGGGMMMQRQMIATSDGGVVILDGPKLTKYDSGLTLVKSVELPRPTPPKDREEHEDQE